MATKKVPTLDEAGKVRDKHLPDRLGAVQLAATKADTLASVPNAVDAKGIKSSSKTWFDKSRRGIFIHCVYGGAGAPVHTIKRDGTLPTSLDDLANNFDVTKLANNLASFGVDYVVFTAWHFAMYALYPSSVMNSILPGHATTTRDVLAELIAALKPKGIKVVFYVHPIDGQDLTPAEQAAAGWNDPTNSYATWANFINDLITECGNRYGNDLDGFWVDMVQDPNFSTRIVDKNRFRRSLKAGNPSRVLIANRGTSDASNVDYTLAALYNGVVEHSTREYIGWPATASAIGGQNSTAALLGSDWMSTKTESGGWTNGRTAADLFRYMVLNAGTNKYGGGTIYAAGPYAGIGATSLWEPGVEAQFNAINSLVAPIRESLHNVIASASFPTGNTVTLASLGTPGFVATRAADAPFEYIHVLTPPAGGATITLPVPVDGAEFYAGTNLRTGNAVTVTPTSTGISLTLASNDTWDANDTVIKLSRVVNHAERHWIGAGNFGSANGATFSSQAVSGRWAAWSMSPTTNMQVEANFSVPQHWNSFLLTIYLAQPAGATGTGDAILSITQATAVPGGVTNVDGQGWGQTWTMPGDTVTLGALTPFTAISNQPHAIHHLRISRNAVGAGDTGPTLAVLGVMARRVS
jgi:hypothetical protein